MKTGELRLGKSKTALAGYPAGGGPVKLRGGTMIKIKVKKKIRTILVGYLVGWGQDPQTQEKALQAVPRRLWTYSAHD